MAKLTLSFKDRKLKLFALENRPMRIGRAEDCEIRIDSLAVEEHHATIEPHEQGFRITPTAPIESLTINHQATNEHLLEDGDHIQVGKHTLLFDADNALHESTSGIAVRPRQATGWLQIMSGSHLGRTIRLDRSMTRVGKSGKASAVIARRDNGYYISHLEGDTPPKLNKQSIGESSALMKDGDQIDIQGLILHFFLDSAESAGAPEPVPSEEKAQRRFTRIPFEAQVTLRSEQASWESDLIDLSLKGALIKRPENWDADPDQEYVLSLKLDNEVAIAMDVTIAHVGQEQIGLNCKDIDVDSITHLRRLVELNLGDAQLLERELAQLG